MRISKRIFFSIVQIALATAVLTSSCTRNKPPAAELKLRLPECVIIDSENAGANLNLEAYKSVLNAVALEWRMESPSGIERLAISESRLLLIVPKRTRACCVLWKTERFLLLKGTLRFPANWDSVPDNP